VPDWEIACPMKYRRKFQMPSEKKVRRSEPAPSIATIVPARPTDHRPSRAARRVRATRTQHELHASGVAATRLVLYWRLLLGLLPPALPPA
jgi:hypothetical protein